LHFVQAEMKKSQPTRKRVRGDLEDKSSSKTRPAGYRPDKRLSGRTKLTGLTLYLSAEAREKLQKLRFKSLDGRGQMPNASEVIERLINEAVKNEPEMPYPKIG
jgi:hypothetical protein